MNNALPTKTERLINSNRFLLRRLAVKKISLAIVSTGVLAMMPDNWVKPVVDVVILPAHAMCSVGCPDVAVRVHDLDAAPAGGGDASFLIEISSNACDPVAVNATVDNGLLVGSSAGDVQNGSPLALAWTGPGVPGSGIPLNSTMLSVDWICSNGKNGAAIIDLRDLAASEASAS